jgi:hypothetical protein
MFTKGKLKFRTVLTRLTQFILGMDGILHLAEVVASYYEEAWKTLVLTSFHSIVFFIALYLVGHDHTHHIDSE